MRNSNAKGEYRSIFVPLDGSEFAEHALPPALSLARRHGASLHIARVYVPVAGVYGEHAVRYDEALDRELMKRAGDYVDDIATRLSAVAPVQVNSALIEGEVADAIARRATEVKADLIVMTTQGRGPLAKFWFGSVSDKLVRQAGVPILFVRPQTATPDLAQMPLLQRVMIPLDGSALAESILGPVLALGDRAQVEYTLLRVVIPVAEFSYGPAGGKITGFQEALKKCKDLDERELLRARDYLECLAERMRANSFAVNTRVVSSERPATAILDDASAHGTDLIALATHGHGGVKRLILGSVADKVLRRADTAVLVYRPVDGSAATKSATLP
jgi:nucleotide-binding universal stress UspA family protein